MEIGYTVSIACVSRRTEYVITFPRSRGGSGVLNLKSALAGVMFLLRVFFCKAAFYKWR